MDTNMMEKQADPAKPAYLYWCKSTRSSTGILVPSGKRCTYCIEVQLHYFPECETVGQMDEKLTDPDVVEVWWEKRGKRVRKEDSYARKLDQNCDVAVEQKETQYEDNFETGKLKKIEVLCATAEGIWIPL